MIISENMITAASSFWLLYKPCLVQKGFCRQGLSSKGPVCRYWILGRQAEPTRMMTQTE